MPTLGLRDRVRDVLDGYTRADLPWCLLLVGIVQVYILGGMSLARGESVFLYLTVALAVYHLTQNWQRWVSATYTVARYTFLLATVAYAISWPVVASIYDVPSHPVTRLLTGGFLIIWSVSVVPYLPGARSWLGFRFGWRRLYNLHGVLVRKGRYVAAGKPLRRHLDRYPKTWKR